MEYLVGADMIGAMKTSILLFTRRNKPSSREASRELTAWLKSRGHEVIDVSDTDGKLTEKELKNVAVGVVIGGDGTFLTLVRRLEKKNQLPLMGVNCGTLGFITEIGREEMLSTMQIVLEKKCTEELRRLLHVELWRNGKCHESGIVFNDAVITKDAKTTMLKFGVSIDGEHMSHVRADGYIVSTPTGSTAYCLSAGGPLLHPMVSGMVLVPLCAHSLSARPIVIPSTMTVDISLHEFNGPVYLVFDGQIGFEIERDDQIKIRTSESSLRLIRPPKRKWSEALRSKLNMA